MQHQTIESLSSVTVICNKRSIIESIVMDVIVNELLKSAFPTEIYKISSKMWRKALLLPSDKSAISGTV